MNRKGLGIPLVCLGASLMLVLAVASSAGAQSCVPDGGVDDTLYQASCCSGYAVPNSTYCSNPADWGTTWESCNHWCGTPPVNGCIPDGGVDDTLYATSCCSGRAVPGSTRCLNPADYGTTWTTCIQTCDSAAPSCAVPPFAPAFWNDNGTVQYNNNCYNYSTNTRTNTFAQPGRASGAWCSSGSCMVASTIAQYTANDGLTPSSAAAACPGGQAKVALVIWPNYDYHFYRRDSSGWWSHKPGSTPARNVDNSGQLISNPETADRGGYTVFAGYFCTCSSSAQGQGHARIN